MIELNEEQLNNVKEITNSYEFSADALINNNSLKFSFEKGYDGSQRTSNIKITNFFMSEDFIGFEENSKIGSYRNIEFKLKDELNNTLLNNSKYKAFLMKGKHKSLSGNFIMIAEKEWDLDHNLALRELYKKYPEAREKNKQMYDINTSQFWHSYLEDANPIFINPYTTEVFTYNASQQKEIRSFKNPTNFDYFPFIKDTKITPDLEFRSRVGDDDIHIPVHYNKNAKRITGIGISSFDLRPMIYFFSKSEDKYDSNINCDHSENKEKMLKTFGNSPRDKKDILFIHGEPIKEELHLTQKEISIMDLWNKLTEEYREDLTKNPVTPYCRY